MSLRKGTGKKPGGQEGHEGSTLKMVAHPDQVVLHTANKCEECGRDLTFIQGELADRRQVVDIPPLTPIYIEHQIANKKMFLWSC